MAGSPAVLDPSQTQSPVAGRSPLLGYGTWTVVSCVATRTRLRSTRMTRPAPVPPGTGWAANRSATAAVKPYPAGPAGRLVGMGWVAPDAPGRADELVNENPLMGPGARAALRVEPGSCGG